MTDTSYAQFQPPETPRFTQEITPTPTLRYPIPISPVPLQTANTTVLTANVDIDFHVESLRAVNVTSTGAHVTVYVVPNGGTAGTGNAVVFQKAVPANDFVTLFMQEGMLLVPPEHSLVASCQTNNAINLHGFGYEYLGVFSG